MKPFPLAVAGIFVVLALGSVLVFATYTSIQSNAIGKVLIWGSLPIDVMEPIIQSLGGEKDTSFDDVSYEYIPEATFIPELITAIASGRGPDMAVLPGAYLISEGDKLITIPYSSYSRRDFQDTYLEIGEVLLGADGIKGLPLAVDPLVLYWNRSLFSSAGVSQVPRYWDEVSAIAPRLSVSDAKGTLTQSALAFGTWGNVDHAKEVMVTLFSQLGNKVVVKGADGYQTTLRDNAGAISPSDSALRFYTDFADPVKPLYSWNRSQPNSRDAFIAGRLAMYVGLASELYSLRAQNPNLNFDVASVPSIRGGGSETAAGLLTLAIPRGSRNAPGALQVILEMTSPTPQEVLESLMHIPSARRDASVGEASDPYFMIFRNAALASFSFLDPNPKASDAAFSRMVEGVSSGGATVSESISRAALELDSLLGGVQ